jgi:hypothetical protein
MKCWERRITNSAMQHWKSDCFPQLSSKARDITCGLNMKGWERTTNSAMQYWKSEVLAKASTFHFTVPIPLG